MIKKINAEPAKTELVESNDLIAQPEMDSDTKEFPVEKIQAGNEKRPEPEYSTGNTGTPEPESPADASEASEEESTAGVEDLPEQEQPAIVKMADPPIKLDQSAGIMDLNKLLENKKCMVLLGTGEELIIIIIIIILNCILYASLIGQNYSSSIPGA